MEGENGGEGGEDGREENSGVERRVERLRKERHQHKVEIEILKEKELVEATARIKELLKEVEYRDEELKHSESMFNIMTSKHNELNSG
eukprot:evm.model.NODE_53264_length_13989_cov_12.001072.3